MLADSQRIEIVTYVKLSIPDTFKDEDAINKKRNKIEAYAFEATNIPILFVYMYGCRDFAGHYPEREIAIIFSTGDQLLIKKPITSVR